MLSRTTGALLAVVAAMLLGGSLTLGAGAGPVAVTGPAREGTVAARTVFLQVHLSGAGPFWQACSGTLVGPTTVATAAHCLQQLDPVTGTTRVAERVLVVPGQYRDSDGAVRRPYGWCTAARWAAPAPRPLTHSPDDYAAVELGACVDAHGEPVSPAAGLRTGYSRLAEAPADTAQAVLSYVGYPRRADADPPVGWQQRAMVRAEPSHHAGVRMMSGRPVLAQGGSGAGLHLRGPDGVERLVAVQVSRAGWKLAPDSTDRAVFRPMDATTTTFFAHALAGRYDVLRSIDTWDTAVVPNPSLR